MQFATPIAGRAYDVLQLQLRKRMSIDALCKALGTVHKQALKDSLRADVRFTVVGSMVSIASS